MYTQNQLAFCANAFPCNPIPFLLELAKKVQDHGTDYIKTDQAKMYLLTINQIAYGQLATIDTVAEFERLYKIVKKESTPVTFYIDNGDNGQVFAFFPNTMQSYSHVGQHSACILEYVKSCVPATVEQYEPLKKELESLGYNLTVLTLPIF